MGPWSLRRRGLPRGGGAPRQRDGSPPGFFATKIAFRRGLPRGGGAPRQRDGSPPGFFATKIAFSSE